MTIVSAIQMLEDRIERGTMSPGERKFLRDLRKEIDNDEPMPVALPEQIVQILEDEGLTYLDFMNMGRLNSDRQGWIFVRIRNEVNPIMSWPAIGRCFGVSHSTPLTSAKRAAAKRGVDLR